MSGSMRPNKPPEDRPGQRAIIVGFGSIASGILPLLRQHWAFTSITIYSKDETFRRIADDMGVEFKTEAVSRTNYLAILDQLKRGDWLLNLAVEVSSCELVDACQERGIFYIDTALELWPDQPSASHHENASNIAKRKGAGRSTAVVRHGANPGLVQHFTKQALLNMAADCGLGLASPPKSREEWAQLAHALGIRVIHIAERDTQKSKTHRRQLDEFVNTWSVVGLVDEALKLTELAWGSHEKYLPRDLLIAPPAVSLTTTSATSRSSSQAALDDSTGSATGSGSSGRTSSDGRPDASVEDLDKQQQQQQQGQQQQQPGQQAAACASPPGSPLLHSRQRQQQQQQQGPSGAVVHRGCVTDPTMVLSRPSMLSRVLTWCPAPGPQIARMINHPEPMEISTYLSIVDPATNELVYRPTSYYAYHLCDEAETSLDDLSARSFNKFKRTRIIGVNEIEEGGMDQLGVLLMGNAKGAYWYGSSLTIDEARQLAPHNNATSLQVVSSIMGAMKWVEAHPQEGLLEPMELDFEEVLQVAMPYLGRVHGEWTRWTPLEGRCVDGAKGAAAAQAAGLAHLAPFYSQQDIDPSDPWQHKNFVWA